MTALPQLDPQRIWFPPVESASDDPNGLLAFGGDLRSERLLAAYQRGIFPWYQSPQPILWWSPDPRAVLFPEKLHISRSLRRTLRRGRFEVTMDRCLEAVISQCAAPVASRPDTWITAEMRRAYLRLHQLGHAHSVEVWQGQQLVGGLYGVALGGVFFGESMFSRVADASKVALVHLCGQLQAWGFAVIDCQVGNGHTAALGAEEICRAHFQTMLRQQLSRTLEVNGRPWNLNWQWSALPG
jgi:leucyl/phenylalanyl-tRNA--protein transferase